MASRGDFAQVHMPDECFVPTEGQPVGNVRNCTEYRAECCAGMKLPTPTTKVLQEHRDAHEYLFDQEIEALAALIHSNVRQRPCG